MTKGDKQREDRQQGPLIKNTTQEKIFRLGGERDAGPAATQFSVVHTQFHYEVSLTK